MKTKFIFIVVATLAPFLSLSAEDKLNSQHKYAEELVDLLPIKQGFITLINQAKTDNKRELENALDWESVKRAYIKAYAETYSEQQLRDFITFFESPEGKAWIAGQQKIMILTSTD